MSERILHIRESIALARQTETETNSLQTYIEAKLPSLHHSIRLPKKNASRALFNFITQYIEHVPDFIEALTELTKQAGIYEHTKVFLIIAEDFFFQPPNLVNEHSGLHVLIDEAYLAHRLIEEVNDRMMFACGMPLAPMDMTLSNIIVHDLLGDEFANQLDLAVHYTIEALFQNENVLKQVNMEKYRNIRESQGWSAIVEKWPCLAGDSSITLNLSNPEPEAEVELH